MASNPAPETPPSIATEDLVAAARDWLQRRGVPLLLGPEALDHPPGQARRHRLGHAIFSLGFAASFALVFAALFVDTRKLGWKAQVAVAVGVVLLVLVVSAIQRAQAGRRGLDLLPPPGRMNVSVVLALMAVPTLDAVHAEEIRLESALLFAAGVVSLLLIAAATPLGALRILWWAVGHPVRELRQNLKVLAGALPLLLLTLAFLLLTTEIWVVATYLSVPELVGTLGLFGGLGLCFLLALAGTRIAKASTFSGPEDVRACLNEHPTASSDPIEALDALVNDCLKRAASFEQWAQVQTWLQQRSAQMPAEAAEEPGALDTLLGRLGMSDKLRESLFSRQRKTRDQLTRLRNSEWPSVQFGSIPALTWRERWNITLVVLFGQGFQVLVVGFMMGIFFLVFGWLTIDVETLRAWEIKRENGWWLWSGQHLKVAALLATFAGLSYAVYAALFKEQRELFLRQLDHKMRQRLAVRALFRALQARSDAS